MHICVFILSSVLSVNAAPKGKWVGEEERGKPAVLNLAKIIDPTSFDHENDLKLTVPTHPERSDWYRFDVTKTRDDLSR